MYSYKYHRQISKEAFSFERKSNLTEDEKTAFSGIIADYDVN